MNNSKNNNLIDGISFINNIVFLKAQSNHEAHILKALSDNDIKIILIAKASEEDFVCISINNTEATKAKELFANKDDLYPRSRWGRLSFQENLSIITIAGENMRGVPGTSSRLFNALGRNGVNIVAIAQGASEFSISVVVSERDADKAFSSVKEAFLLSNFRALNLFVVGTGLIGGVLVKQIQEEYQKLRNEQGIDIRVCGLANGANMILDKDGVDLLEWEKKIEQGGQTNIYEFVSKIKEFNLANSVFVDCTASEEIASMYATIFNNYISVVTPNKKANSGFFSEYKNLKDLAREKNVSFLYETNVGAGLPVINTLRDLLASGDKILKIEAVLSGTLSYIFNNFSTSEKLFSDIVVEAKERGYTEPDPRDDLNGMDVARKILILAREIGLPLEIKDIEIEPLISKKCEEANSIAAFFVNLKEVNNKFEQRRNEARAEEKVFRYIASLENGKAKVSLQIIGSDNPFYSLSGSDNMISFTTRRYHETPLVVKGPGAGSEVTAGGVLADIIRIAQYA